jgi:hypothetical protein
MSISMVAFVWEMDLPGIEKSVMAALADRANPGHDWQAWPSIEWLVKRTGFCDSAVRQALKRLAKMGLIEAKRRFSQTTIYSIMLPGFNAVPDTEQGELYPVSDNDTVRCQTPIRPVRDTDKPVKEPVKRTSKGAREEITFPDWWPKEAWQAYLDMRKAKRKSPTDYAIRKVIAAISGWKAEGQDPAQILDQSTVQGWTGVFAVKGFTKPPPPRSAHIDDDEDQVVNV